MIARKPTFGDLFLVGAVLAAAIIVNPVRELLTWDDGWAYARSVSSLITTGRYQLDQWAAANMPVQIGIAAVFAKLFGYSFTLLRLTTLGLSIVLLLAFRRLLEANGSPPALSLAVTLALFASPVTTILSFTFMSDVQFLAWLIVALALYGTGLTREKSWLIFAGSIAAAAAIGTRQFGIAMLVGWAFTFALSSRQQRPSIATLLLATGLPGACMMWQLWMGAGEPNVTQAYRLAEQHVLITQPIRALAREVIWRGAIWVQYSALYLIPLMPVVIGTVIARLRKVSPWTQARAAILTILLMACVAVGLSLNSALTVRPGVVPGAGWPALAIIWVIPSQPWVTQNVLRLLDLAGFAAIAPLSLLLFTRLKLLPTHRPNPNMLLIAGTGVALFGMLFVYVQLNDTYVVALLPFLLIGFAAALGEVPSRFWINSTIVWSFAILAMVSGLTRHNFNAQQRLWDAADRAVAHGPPYDQVAGPKHWAEYHGAFDDWVAAGTPGLHPPPRNLHVGQDPFHDPFYQWLHERDVRNLSTR
jgi:hypothetical protein